MTRHTIALTRDGAIATLTIDRPEKRNALTNEMLEEIERLARQYQFFHWHLAFPDVFRAAVNDQPADNPAAGWNGGFDAVLGNPPWEQIQFDPQEYFAITMPEIANAQHMSARNKMIEALQESDSQVYSQYEVELRRSHGTQSFVHNSGLYPLTSYGRLNTAPLFSELSRRLVIPSGRIGIVVPSGIAFDSFNQFFFQDIIKKQSLIRFFDFENREGLFKDVDSRYKLSLLTMTSEYSPWLQGGEFVFFAQSVQDTNNLERRFNLTAP